MNAQRFDDLTRALGRSRSRRQVLKGLLGGAAAALVAAATGGTATASRGGLGGVRPAGGQPCSQAQCMRDAFQLWKQCDNNCGVFCNRHGFEHHECEGCKLACFTARKIDEAECRAHSGCASGECCNEACTDTQSDNSNCGDCGVGCTGGRTCQLGSCQCPDGQDSCGSYCADLNNDADNCGGCGVKCGTCETCVEGACLATDCGPGGVCCNSSCIPACGAGLSLDLDTCQCVAACQSDCMVVQGGQCVPAPDGTPCEGFDICCGGVCGAEACGWVPDPGSDPNEPSYHPTYCCGAGTTCVPYGDQHDTCCPADYNGITPDGQCCAPGSTPVSCTFPNGTVTYECCTYPEQGMNECNCCGNCCDNVTCSVHML